MKKKGISFLTLPMYIWTLIFVLLPIVYIVFLSFLKTDTYEGIIYEFNLGNYKALFLTSNLKIMWRSVQIAFYTTFFTLIIAVPFSYFTSRLRGRMRTVIMFLVALPFWTNSLIRIYAVMNLLQGNGLINSLLMSMGIIESPLPLLYNQKAVILGMVYSFLPLMILPVYSAVSKPIDELLEASADLGAGRIYTFIHIVLPAAVPGILSGLVLVFVPSVGMYFISDMLGGAKIMMLGNLISENSAASRNRPFAAALSVLMLAVATAFIMLYRRISGKKAPMGVAG